MPAPAVDDDGDELLIAALATADRPLTTPPIDAAEPAPTPLAPPRRARRIAACGCRSICSTG